MKLRWGVSVVVAVCCGMGQGQEAQPRFGARDAFAEYKLRRLKDQAGDTLWKSETSVQVLSRARKMGLNAESATDAWMDAGATYTRAEAAALAAEPAHATEFRGIRASELNALLAAPETRAVTVGTQTLEMDTPLRIGRENVSLNLGRTQLRAGAGVGGPYLIEVRGADGVRITGGVLGGQGWGVLVAGSRNVALLRMEMDGLAGGGVVVTGSEAVTVWGGGFHGLGAAPVMLHGATRHAVVAHNEITRNIGGSNWHAGVVITDRNADLASDPKSLLHEDNYGVKEQPIVERLTIPEDNMIADNDIVGNAGSGIYSDGGARNVVAENRIERNAKEGLCLDNGSTANVVAFNTIESNGRRAGKTDDDLKRDFIFDFGRLPDGSSPAKVPGLSMDNAAYNVVMFNEIDRNYGGGIKMVRTGFYNLLGLNTLSDNNEGRSKLFHFFGIELGSARADVKVNDLDFTPSRGNEVFGNTVRGSHYAGIFFAEGSDDNVVFDNSIFGATDWAMESVKPQANESFNNLTNLKLRNVSAGLDPNLLKLGAGEFDRPH